MGTLYICCSCDEHYGGDALACAKAIASGTTTPCACDCHKVPPEPTDNQEIEAAELAVRGLHTCASCGRPNAPADRSCCESCMPRSQVQSVGLPSPRTWDEYERGCLATFGGGYREPHEREIFHHGITTVFNLLRGEFPDACNPDNRGIAWWQGVAEAKQEERDKALAQVADLTARLEQLGALLAKIGRHTSWCNHNGGMAWVVDAPHTPRGVVRAVEEMDE